MDCGVLGSVIQNQPPAGRSARARTASPGHPSAGEARPPLPVKPTQGHSSQLAMIRLEGLQTMSRDQAPVVALRSQQWCLPPVSVVAAPPH